MSTVVSGTPCLLTALVPRRQRTTALTGFARVPKPAGSTPTTSREHCAPESIGGLRLSLTVEQDRVHRTSGEHLGSGRRRSDGGPARHHCVLAAPLGSRRVREQAGITHRIPSRLCRTLHQSALRQSSCDSFTASAMGQDSVLRTTSELIDRGSARTCRPGTAPCDGPRPGRCSFHGSRRVPSPWAEESPLPSSASSRLSRSRASSQDSPPRREEDEQEHSELPVPLPRPDIEKNDEGDCHQPRHHTDVGIHHLSPPPPVRRQQSTSPVAAPPDSNASSSGTSGTWPSLFPEGRVSTLVNPAEAVRVRPRTAFRPARRNPGA